MVSIGLLLSIVTSMMWSIAPRFFRQCDSVLARRRLRIDCGDHHSRASEATPGSSSPHIDSNDGFLSARGFNELARLSRAHFSLHDAVQHITSSTSSDVWKQFANSLATNISVEKAVSQLASQYPTSLSLRLLKATVYNNNFVPIALDHAAMALRDNERTLGEVSLAQAQTQLTVRILTRIPFILIVIAIGVSDSLRHAVTTPAVLGLIIVATALNRLGAFWSSLLVRRLHRPTPADEILDLVTVLLVHVRAGLSLPSACEHLQGASVLGDEIGKAIRDGVPFDEALLPLTTHVDRFAHDVAALLIAAYRDGQPALETINILSHEARRRREQQTQALIRRLPTQLTAPVVLCVLPSFILLVVVPLVVAQLNTLSVGLNA